PKPRHLNGMIDLAARMLPGVIGRRREAGLGRGEPEPGGVLHLEIEGAGGGDWYIGLDGEAGETGAESGRAVAHVALDGVEFCRLAAGHVQPREAAAGQDGDMDAVHEVLFAAASLSRM
ncbi:MDMPI N domain containing protein, partial [Streptomyces albidoflavus]